MFLWYKHICLKLQRYVFLIVNIKTPYQEYIRGYNAKDLSLAQLSDYWNIVFDHNTPPEMTGDRFRITEQILNRTNNELNW